MKTRSRFWFTRSERKALSILLVSTVLFNVGSRVMKVRNHLNSQDIKDLHLSSLRLESRANQFSQQRKKIELNQADSLELTKLYGIGPVFASRIVKYRRLLGGFHDTSQLNEVYGMDSLRLAGFIDQVCIDTSSLRQFNLRTVTFKELLRHPYISYDQVVAFVRYRDVSGPPTQVNELWAEGVWPDTLRRYIVPYLSIAAKQ